MKFSLLFVSVYSVLFFSCKPAWQNYKSTEGHCAINFPGKSVEHTQSLDAANGAKLLIHLVDYSSVNASCMLAWTDMNSCYPAEKSMTQILEASRDGAVANMQATDVETIKTNLENEPYIEFTFKTDKFIGKDRIYMIDKIQYSVIYLTTAGTLEDPNIERFFASFRHI
jgi:hypothetical protein